MAQSDLARADSAAQAPPPQLMSRVERAAVFLSLLEDEEAALLLGRMEPTELEKLGLAMCRLGDIEPPHIAEALSDFVAEAEREIIPARDRPGRVRALLERSLGDTKATSMMLRIDPEIRPRSIEMARWLAPSIVLRLIEDEHPQVIAALLLMLEPEPAAEVLSQLPEKSQPAVVARIAKMGAVSARVTEMVDTLLSQRIGANFGASVLTMGGARDAANLINLAAGEVRNTVLPEIAKSDGPLAEAIEDELFTFEMLLDLDAQNMGRLLRDVDNEALIDALKGLPDAQRSPFFAAMSSRAADGVRDEIELRGRMAKSEAIAAQRKIVEVARDLVEKGEIIMGADDGEFV